MDTHSKESVPTHSAAGQATAATETSPRWLRPGRLGFPVLAAVLAALVVGFFFSPRFVLWRALDFPAGWGNPEVVRAVDTLKKVDSPFTWIDNANNMAINWRLFFPMIGHYLHLPRAVFLALPHLGCWFVLATICHLVYRETGSRRYAFMATVILGATSWFFVSTGWLAYFDSWYILALLGVSFCRSYWILGFACLLAPWIDERFVLTLPLVFVVRAVYFRWIENKDWTSAWKTGVLIAAIAMPYVALRVAAIVFNWDPMAGRFLESTQDELRRALGQNPWVVWDGVWQGLRAAWLLVVVFVWFSSARHSRWWTAGVVVCLLATLALHIRLVVGDLSRTMSAVLPAAVLGVVLLQRRRGAALRYVLPALLAANLLLPAKHVVLSFDQPILYFYAEWNAYQQADRQFFFFNPDFYIQRGMALAQQKKLPAALAEFETALRLDPQNAAVFANRGVVYAEGGDLSAAQADFERAIRMQPKAPELYVNRAHVRRRQDDLRGALEDLQKALSVAPSRWEERNRIEEEVQRLKSIATGSND